MIVTLQQTRFYNLLRRMENRQDLHDDELELRFRAYCDRLFKFLEPYNVVFAGVTATYATICSMRFNLTAHPAHVDKALEGIAVLEPSSIAVEKHDLGTLIGTAPMRTMFEDAWHSIAAELTNIELGGLQMKLESIAGRLLNTPRAVDPVDYELGLSDPELDFKVWCAQNNLPVPGMTHENRERAKAQEAAEYQEYERREMERKFDLGGNSTGWDVREIPKA